MSVLVDKSYGFAIRVVKLSIYLNNEKKEYTLSKQLLRSGTAIGALIAEAQYAQSKADFINKLQIALKEANESKYWIRLLHDTEFLTLQMFESILPDIEALIKMLTSSINTTKERTT
ncbi:four helix bundle protein [Sulfurovum sp. ST-21]|uniref:four helix bundle protein n=1 Tax=Sulfurovum TaxID=265570 RepID=UPI001E53E5B5|nr:four helix bundle protein [Sulfurovum indicum]